MNSVSKARVVALAAGLALTGVACGGGGGGAKDVASLAAGDGEQAAAKTKQVASKDPEQAMLDFAKCMREHGIDMPDPQVDTGDGAGTARPAVAFSIGGDFSPEKMEKADKECRPLMGDAGPMGNISPEERQEMQDKAVEHARCMREHGVDMPDPVFDAGTGGGMVKIDAGAIKAIDIDSEKFQEASEACGSIFGTTGKAGGAVTISGDKVKGGKGGLIISGATASAGSSK